MEQNDSKKSESFISIFLFIYLIMFIIFGGLAYLISKNIISSLIFGFVITPIMCICVYLSGKIDKSRKLMILFSIILFLIALILVFHNLNKENGLFILFDNFGVSWVANIANLFGIVCLFELWYIFASKFSSLHTFQLAENHKILIPFFSILAILFILFSNNAFIRTLGCEDLRVMPEGEYCYYVIAEDNNGHTYTLPAKINKNKKDEYYIENVYFKNGGYLYLASESYEDYDSTFRELDQNERVWEFKLTNRNATVKNFTPDTPKNSGGTFFAIFLSLSVLLTNVFYIKNANYDID